MNLAQAAYHNRHSRERAAAFAALAAVADGPYFDRKGSPLVKPGRLDRFAHCATNVDVVRHKERDEWRLSGNLCRDRWCPACAATRRRRIIRTLRPAFAEVIAANPRNRPRLVTLTVRHADEPLERLLRHLKDCWRALTRDPWFRDTQAGGIWALEIKPGRYGGWHPHIHAVIFSPWISARRLRQKWHALTSDSTVVDVRQVNPGRDQSFDGPLGYIAKYIGKPAQLSGWTIAQAAEIIVTARSLRLWSTWGCMAQARKSITEAEDPAYDPADWLYIAPLSEVVLRGLQGDPESVWLLAQLRLHDWHLGPLSTQSVRRAAQRDMPGLAAPERLLPGP